METVACGYKEGYKLKVVTDPGQSDAMVVSVANKAASNVSTVNPYPDRKM